MKSIKKILAFVLSLALCISALSCGAVCIAETNQNNEDEVDYMRIKNLNGPSGVALGGIGVGYYEIDPTGKVTRSCLNNIHKSFADSPAGFLVGAWDGSKATRLQRDNNTTYGMQGYTDSYYTGLWPSATLEFENSKNGAADMGFTAYSAVTAQNVKDSSLPVVYYDVELSNTDSTAKQMSAILTWGDLIGRGIRDTDLPATSATDGESSDWYDMATPQTYAKGISIMNGNNKYSGVIQYAKQQILPKRATFQNYNNSFMILAEDNGDTGVTILKNFNVNDNNALSSYTSNGALNPLDGSEVALSAPTNGSRTTSNGSAVAVSSTVNAGETKTVRFMVSWFMPEITDAQYRNMQRFSNCDYNKYYHNYFSNIEDLSAYAIGNRANVRNGIDEWQQPLINSSLPDWMVFKQINSGYTLYTNGVLNKKGNFSTLEGEMGGYGGTQDQKMSSFVFYEKLFPSLNLTENLQYANVTGANKEIQHFDVHYYHGMSDFDSSNTANPTPAGSMIDNTGAWMMQMWNYYRQTGSTEEITEYYNVMKDSMAFLKTKYVGNTHIPHYNTTYDDYSHPQIISYSGTVWLCMLEIAEQWAQLMGDAALAQDYKDDFDLSYIDTNALYNDWLEESGYDPYYCYGGDSTFVETKGAAGSGEDVIMFSGAVAGEFMSRYFGLGDIIPFENYYSHMKTFLATSIQQSNDYYAPKVYNIRSQTGLDAPYSGCWPFYLESYGAMAAIQAGYLEDGLEVLLHTMQVDLVRGFMWSRSLWTRAYITYMTAPVSWMMGDVLAGSAVDVPNSSLTFGPTCIASEGVGRGDSLQIPLYYPKYWAMVDYRPNEGVFNYEIIKTFYEQNEAPITINNVIAAPTGVASNEQKSITLNQPFTVTEGAVLDLSDNVEDFEAEITAKSLQPVAPYEDQQVDIPANGKGLTAKIYQGSDTSGDAVETYLAKGIKYTFDSENPPAAGIDGKYTALFDGSVQPKYGQKYQLIFEYTGNAGDLSVKLDGKDVLDYSSDPKDIESQQFTPTPGCRLFVITRTLEAGKKYPISITYKGDISNDEQNQIRFLWWSTTQQMSLVPPERLYPIYNAYEWNDGTMFTEANIAKIETNDHMAYTQKGSWVLYNDVDFGSGGYDLEFQIMAASPNGEFGANGGTLEIHLDSKDGQLIASKEYTPTGSWSNYQQFNVPISDSSNLKGRRNICLVFKPNDTYLFNYKNFRFAGFTSVSAYKDIDGKTFAEKSGDLRIEGDHVGYTTSNSYALYRMVDFGNGGSNFVMKINAAAINNEHSQGGKMEVHLDNNEGQLIGTLDFEPTGAWDNYQTFSFPLSNASELKGARDICLVFKPTADYVFNYTTFVFERGSYDFAQKNFDAYEQIDGTKYSEGTVGKQTGYVENIKNNTYAIYKGIDFGTENSKKKFSIMAAAPNNEVSSGGKAEIRLNDTNGTLLGTLDFTPTGTWNNYQEFSTYLDCPETLNGLVDICLVFKPNSTYLFNYTTISFSEIKTLLYGDVNFDKRVSAVDALMTLHSACGKRVLTQEQFTAADVDGSKVVNATDALLILQYDVKLISRFPVEQ